MRRSIQSQQLVHWWKTKPWQSDKLQKTGQATHFHRFALEREREGKYPELDRKLAEWITTARMRGFLITEAMTQSRKAEWVAKQLQEEGADGKQIATAQKQFQGSNGRHWVKSFERRFHFAHVMPSTYNLLTDDQKEHAMATFWAQCIHQQETHSTEIQTN